MALAVIGAGLGRTGTLSLKVALEQLGFGPCHHMDDVFSSPERLRTWAAIAAGNPADWPGVFAGYQSTIDWPSTNYWRELADAFPQAKILLSVRPPERWWSSFESTIRKLIDSRDKASSDHIANVLEYAHTIINQHTFGGDTIDKSSALEVFDRRIKEVTATIPAERLLVFDVAHGWEPLCEFVGQAVPDADFPHVNNEDEFWQHFGAGVQSQEHADFE